MVPDLVPHDRWGRTQGMAARRGPAPRLLPTGRPHWLRPDRPAGCRTDRSVVAVSALPRSAPIVASDARIMWHTRSLRSSDPIAPHPSPELLADDAGRARGEERDGVGDHLVDRRRRGDRLVGIVDRPPVDAQAPQGGRVGLAGHQAQHIDHGVGGTGGQHARLARRRARSTTSRPRRAASAANVDPTPSDAPAITAHRPHLSASSSFVVTRSALRRRRDGRGRRAPRSRSGERSLRRSPRCHRGWRRSRRGWPACRRRAASPAPRS